MQVVDVYKKESGKLWHRRLSADCNGQTLLIAHTVPGSSPLQSHNVRFLSVAFDSTGERFLAGDHQGNVFLFDIYNNRFTLVQKTGNACGALAFGLHRQSEFLIAMADHSLKCFDTVTKEMVAMMKGHQTTIHSISVHSSGRYAITTSSDTAQLWDLDSFQRRRKLSVKENVGIIKVFFLPLSNTIITCFKDDSIFAWEFDTLQCKYQLYSPKASDKSPAFKAFTATKDGQILVGGGRSRFLHIWSIEGRYLIRVIELQSKVTCVNHLEFLPDAFDTRSNQILGVLSQDGVIRFVHIHTCTQLFNVGRLDDRISHMAISPSGHHIVALKDSGDVCIYSVQALSKEHNKPPAPLVKVVTLANTAAATSKTSKNSATCCTSGLRTTRILSQSKNWDISKLGQSKDSCMGMSELPEAVSMDRLTSILKGYGEYPAKYRMFIWRSILHLPENHEAYAALVEKGTHPAYEKLHEDYPVKSRKLLRVLQRVLSALAHWSPIFGETEYLPLFVFPFVKLFQNNQLVCFEIIATVIISWCPHWFEYFPNPPINILGLIENVLAFHDKELLQHFTANHINSQIYAWPLLETFFSEVLTREEWLKLTDNIFSNHPSYLLMVVVAYCTVGRAALLYCTEHDDFKLISEAYRLMGATPADVHPRNTLEDFVPLTRGLYPVFNKYPKFIVDFQVVERARIRQQEQEYLQQTVLASELRVESQKRLDEEKSWYNQQQLLSDAENTRRLLIAKEEQNLAEQRARLNAMKREMKMKELQLLDATRRKFMMFTQQQKETELIRLDDEISRKVCLRASETQAAVDEIAIRNMELQVQKKLFEQELLREHADLTGRHRAEVEAWTAQSELRVSGQHSTTNTQNADLDIEVTKLQDKTTLLADISRATCLPVDADNRTEHELRRKLNNSEAERTATVLKELQSQNQQLEESIEKMMEELKVHRLHGVERDLPDLHYSRSSGAQASMTPSTSNSDQSPQTHQPSNDNHNTVSLDRGRRTFDEREKQLMAQVLNVRRKLAADNKTRNKPIPMYEFDRK